VSEVVERLGYRETITVDRERLRAGLSVLLERLPDMLGESSKGTPMMLRAVLPGLRMFLASPDMQKTLQSDEVISAVWEALSTCQSDR
jgi:hypothetical protein